MSLTTIFFDLDHTLWDFETNSTETLKEIIEDFKLEEKGLISSINFIRRYQQINDQLWDEYRKGLIDRETLRNTRFHRALLEFNINDQAMANDIGEYYLRASPLKRNLFPHAIETLSYLKKKYELHIITNGFNEVQFIKLDKSGLLPFFKHVITSEAANSKKPEHKIFEYALNLSSSSVEQSLMIGDSMEQDILGAKNFGMQQVFFNPGKIKHDEKISYEIHSLDELKNIL